MDPQTLERLLIDRGLGELSPDVSALLEAYLDSTPEAHDIAGEIETTLAVARQTFHASEIGDEEALPELRLKATAPVMLRPQQNLRTWSRSLAVAAAIMIGFFLGSWHGAGLTEPDRSPVHMVEASPEPQTAEPDGFWSLSRWQDAKEKDHRTISNQPRIHWSNPINKPQIGAPS